MSSYETGRYGAGYLFPHRYPVSSATHSAEGESLIDDRQSFISSMTTSSHRNSENHPRAASSLAEQVRPEYKSKIFAAGPLPKYWNSLYLTKTTLGCFIASGVLLTAALVALYVVSIKESGLVSQDDRYRYTWTYGPTAVIVLLASVWMRVDHWAKTLVPYQRMRKATTPANQNILQDYLSPWNVFALISSIRNRDFAVTSAILGSILLQLTVIVSTSILLLEARQIPVALTLTVTTSFVASAPILSPAVIDGTPVERFYGIASGRIAHTPAVSSDMVIENFYQNNTAGNNSTYSAKVAGMSASLDCQPLELKNNSYRVSMPWQSILAPGFAIDINTTDCFIRGVPIGIGADHAPPIQLKISTTFQGWWSNYTCNDNFTNYRLPQYNSDPRLVRPAIPGFNDKRLVFITSTVQWSPEPMGNGMARPTWVQNYTGVICKPSYSIDDYSVTYSPKENITDQPFAAIKQQGTSRKVTNFADLDLPLLLYTALGKSHLYNSPPRDLNAPAVIEEDAGYVRAENKFFMVMNQLNGPSQTSAFTNQSAMLEFVPKAFSGILAHVFERHFTTPTNREIPAQALFWQNRLIMKTIPTILMIALLILTTLSFILMFLTRPYNVVPLDPQTLSAQAKIVASSPLSTILQSFTGPRADRMSVELSRYEYHTTVHPTEDGTSFVINRSSSTDIREEEPKVTPGAQHHTWWRPITSKILFTTVLLFSTLAIIATLEALQRLSDSQNGILSIQESNHIFITLVPAAVLTAISLAYTSVNFNVALIAPFAALKRRPRPHQHGLDVALIGKPSIIALFEAAKHSLKLPVFGFLAVIIGSFLTIVVSGLYYIENVPLSTPVTLRRIDQFNYTTTDLRKGDNSAAVAAKLIWYENAAYPKWTYDKLVFPQLEITNIKDSVPSTGYVDVQVPAIRPKLSCITIPPAAILWSSRYKLSSSELNSESRFVMNISAFIDVPCFERADGSGRIINCKYPWSTRLVPTIGGKDEILGFASSSLVSSPLGCLAYSPPSNATYVGDLKNRPRFPLARGCPSFQFVYGTVSTNRIDNTTVGAERPYLVGGLCFHNVETVDTSLQLNLPTLTISTSNPPVVIENSAKLVNITSGNYTGPNYYTSIETLRYTLPPENESLALGPYFQALVEGRTHLKPTDLVGDLPRILNATNELYAVYMAQAINANFRYDPTRTSSSQSPVSSAASSNTTQAQFSGTMSNTNRQRFKQQPQLKIALQVMLAVMLVCGFVILVFSDRKAILPHNPCTIAGTMVLFAGSEMATRKLIPVGSEWSNNNAFWEGWLFSLGWWGTREHPRYGIDVGKAEKSVDDLPSNSDASKSASEYWSTAASHGTRDPYNATKGSAEVYEMNMFDRTHSRDSIDMGDMRQQYVYDHVSPQGGYNGYSGATRYM